ncbi:MAG: hypothetical protein KDJ97_27475 [Anaerolineae bacterium]|nr:hypothetical protein [Anaerolineae bacterium]
MMQTLRNARNGLSFNLFSESQQEDRLARIPWWVWGALVFLVVIVAIIVTRRENEELAAELPGARLLPPSPKPVSQPFAPAPVPIIEAVEPVPVAPPEPVAPTVPPRPDNLKRIKGVGPKIEKLLNENGITTFAQVASMDPREIQALLNTVDWTDLANPTTWPAQAGELE